MPGRRRWNRSIAARSARERFFNDVHAWVAEQPRPARPDCGRDARAAGESVRVQEPNIVADPLSEELTKLADAHPEDCGHQILGRRQNRAGIGSDSLLELAQSLRQWLGQELAGQVYWVEVSGERTQRIDLASAPIEVGPALREQLYDKVPTVVMTSATLSVGGRDGFRHFQGRLGLEGCETLQLGSPFNYREQVELHLFRQMPDPAADPDAYEEAVPARFRNTSSAAAAGRSCCSPVTA